MQLIKIRQQFDTTHIPAEHIEETLRNTLEGRALTIPQGGSIAIAVGSRGIANLVSMVKTLVHWVREKGGTPFLVPAMGSHGGATAAGQQAVLHSYGLTEDGVGAPIQASMEVVELPRGACSHRVFMDALAYHADGVIILNRVKPHTAFHGPIESGLLKMCVIGLGKHRGALELHAHGAAGLRDLIPPTAQQIIRHSNMLFGVAVVENAYDQTACLRVAMPEEFESTDQELLCQAKAFMPCLPVDALDVLIVDEFGKHISGAGMDVNIIGRMKIAGQAEPESPTITSIILRDLAEQSHGNANGMGLADVITRRFFIRIDFQATYENVVTTGFLERGKLPVVAETDRLALEYALKPCGLQHPQQARIIEIAHTLKLDEIWVSPNIADDLRNRPEIVVTDERRDRFP